VTVKLELQLKITCHIITLILSILMSLFADPLSCWSADECANFVSGLRQYGKDFYLIHQNKVATVWCTFVHLHFTCYC